MMARGFGRLCFWHLVPGAPQAGTPAERAQALLDLLPDRVNEITPKTPDKANDIFKALVLELAIADNGQSAVVAELVAQTLPKWAYAVLDPVFVYSGQGAGKGSRSIADRRLKTLAKGYDYESTLATGKPMPMIELVERLMKDAYEDEQISNSDKVKDQWGEAPAIDRTVGRWRKEADYRSDLAVARIMWEQRQDT